MCVASHKGKRVNTKIILDFIKTVNKEKIQK